MTKSFVCPCRQLIYGSLNDLKSSVILTPSLSAVGIKAQSWQNTQSKQLPRSVLLSLSTCPGSSMILRSFKPQENILLLSQFTGTSQLLQASCPGSGCFIVLSVHSELFAFFAWVDKALTIFCPSCLSWEFHTVFFTVV